MEVQLADDDGLKDILIHQFDAIDKDGDGKVNEEDLVSALATMFQYSKSRSESILLPSSDSVMIRQNKNDEALNRIIEHLNALTDANAGDLMIELKTTV